MWSFGGRKDEDQTTTGPNSSTEWWRSEFWCTEFSPGHQASRQATQRGAHMSLAIVFSSDLSEPSSRSHPPASPYTHKRPGYHMCYPILGHGLCAYSTFKAPPDGSFSFHLCRVFSSMHFVWLSSLIPSDPIWLFCAHLCPIRPLNWGITPLIMFDLTEKPPHGFECVTWIQKGVNYQLKHQILA